MENPYKSKDWLIENYIEEKMSTLQIGKMCGVSDDCIQYWIKKHRIQMRPPFQKNIISLSHDISEFLTGSLLGDGSICWGYEGVSAYFTISNKYLEYIQYIRSILSNLGIHQRGEISQYSNQWGKWFLWQSKYYRGALADIRTVWYNTGKKTIPKNYILTAKNLNLFYLDDGFLQVEQTGRIASCGLAVNDFDYDSVVELSNQIAKVIGVDKSNIHICNSKSGCVIYIYKRKVIESFFNFIGCCPDDLVIKLGYKWPGDRLTKWR